LEELALAMTEVRYPGATYDVTRTDWTGVPPDRYAEVEVVAHFPDEDEVLVVGFAGYPPYDVCA
jgi:hypothetical protein